VTTWLARRAGASLAALVAASMVVFVAMSLAPGDPASLQLGQDATPEAVRALRAEWGLDDPLPLQYLRFAANALRGDFGRSFSTKNPIADDLARTFPATLQLTGAALGIAVALGVPAGVLAATRRGRWLDGGTRAILALGLSLPAYWLGLLLIYVFAVTLGWFPTSGRGDRGSLVLPAVTLAAFSAAVIARMTRSSLLETLRHDYVRTARGKGLGEGGIVLRHALRNALIPVTTVVGLQFGLVFGGAVLTETVFAWPGLGRLVLDGVLARDHPLARGGILLIAAVFIAANFVVDLAYFYLDPRIRRA
jgi:peptide/nickel transport system permease protein